MTIRHRSRWVAKVLAGALVAIAVGGWSLGVPTVVVDGVMAAEPSPSASAVAAASARKDAAPAPSELTIVGLGDSVMAGTNCGCDGIVSAYAKAIAARTGQEVTARNFGDPGATSADLLNSLHHDNDVREAVSHADVIVVISGANDLYDAYDRFEDGGCDASCYEPAVGDMKDSLSQAMDVVRTLNPSAELLICDYWAVFRDGAAVTGSGRSAELAFNAVVTDAANSAIAEQASMHDAQLVDLMTPFKGSSRSGDPTSLLAEDGDHPNAAGEARIVAALMARFS